MGRRRTRTKASVSDSGKRSKEKDIPVLAWELDLPVHLIDVCGGLGSDEDVCTQAQIYTDRDEEVKMNIVRRDDRISLLLHGLKSSPLQLIENCWKGCIQSITNPETRTTSSKRRKSVSADRSSVSSQKPCDQRPESQEPEKHSDVHNRQDEDAVSINESIITCTEDDISENTDKKDSIKARIISNLQHKLKLKEEMGRTIKNETIPDDLASKKVLISESPKKKKKVTFKCTMCPNKLSTKTGLQRHMLKVHAKTAGAKAMSKGKKQRTLRKCIDQDPVQKNCSVVTKTESELQGHLLNVGDIQETGSLEITESSATPKSGENKNSLLLRTRESQIADPDVRNDEGVRHCDDDMEINGVRHDDSVITEVRHSNNDDKDELLVENTANHCDGGNGSSDGPRDTSGVVTDNDATTIQTDPQIKDLCERNARHNLNSISNIDDQDRDMAQYQCVVCHQANADYESFMSHISQAHALVPNSYYTQLLKSNCEVLPCPDCELCYSEKKSVLKHVRTQHINQPNYAEILLNVDKMLCERNKLESENSSLLIKCCICDVERSGRGIFRHLQICHDTDENYPTAEKQAQTEYVTKLKASRRTKKAEYEKKVKISGKEYSCQFCSKIFRHRPTKSNHELYRCTANLDRRKLLECYVCGFSTPKKETWEKHKLKHEGKGEENLCAHCGKSYKTRAGLIIHRRKEHNVFTRCPIVRLECDTCHKTFYDKDHLNKHMATHSAERPFQCDLCGRQYKTSVAIQKHRKMFHFNDFKHKCPDCGHGVEKKKYLLTHKCGRVRRIQTDDPWNLETDTKPSKTKSKAKRIKMDLNQIPGVQVITVQNVGVDSQTGANLGANTQYIAPPMVKDESNKEAVKVVSPIYVNIGAHLQSRTDGNISQAVPPNPPDCQSVVTPVEYSVALKDMIDKYITAHPGQTQPYNIPLQYTAIPSQSNISLAHIQPTIQTPEAINVKPLVIHESSASSQFRAITVSSPIQKHSQLGAITVSSSTQKHSQFGAVTLSSPIQKHFQLGAVTMSSPIQEHSHLVLNPGDQSDNTTVTLTGTEQIFSDSPMQIDTIKLDPADLNHSQPADGHTGDDDQGPVITIERSLVAHVDINQATPSQLSYTTLANIPATHPIPSQQGVVATSIPHILPSSSYSMPP